MIKNVLKYLTVIGLAGILFSCEKDEVRVYILDNPIAPTIVSMPDLNLQKSNAADTLVFDFTPVEPGFQASVKYSFEASTSGSNFSKPLSVLSGFQGELYKITVGDLNKIMVKKFKAGQVVVDFRFRAALVVDAGTNLNPYTYSSEIKTITVNLY